MIMRLRFPKRKRKQKVDQIDHEDHRLSARGVLIDIVLSLLAVTITMGLVIFGYELVSGKTLTIPASSGAIGGALKELLQIAVDLLK